MEITQSNQNRTKIITSDGFAYVKKLNLAGGWESCVNGDGISINAKGRLKLTGISSW